MPPIGIPPNVVVALALAQGFDDFPLSPESHMIAWWPNSSLQPHLLVSSPFLPIIMTPKWGPSCSPRTGSLTVRIPANIPRSCYRMPADTRWCALISQRY